MAYEIYKILEILQICIPGHPVRLGSGTLASIKAKIADLLNPTVINRTPLSTV